MDPVSQDTGATDLIPVAVEVEGPRLNYLGRRLLSASRAVHQLVAFMLITLGVAVTHLGTARSVMRRLVAEHVFAAGVRMLPIVSFMGLALGLVVVGQVEMIRSLTSVDSQEFIGMIMVTAVVRELGTMVTALVVLARVGTAWVIELGTARAMGEVEALEALSIDPVHYFVVPRVVGMSVGVFALTIYFNIVTLVSAYIFAFLQDLPLQPTEYLHQIGDALTWQDFLLLGLKPLVYGFAIAIICCFQGLSRPLKLEQLPSAAIRGVVQSLLVCVALDVLFIVFYYFL